MWDAAPDKLRVWLTRLLDVLAADADVEETATDPAPLPQLSQLTLRTRTRNCLEYAGIQTTEYLIVHSEKELLAIRHFGRVSLRNVVDELHRFGLRLSTPVAER